MTAQVTDKVFYERQAFELANTSTFKLLFSPQQHGIDPPMLSTACYRGFYSEFAVINEQLYLTRAFINLTGEEKRAARRGCGPRLFGVHPVRFRDTCNAQFWGVKLPWQEWAVEWLYELDVPLSYTGGILVGRDRVRPYWLVPDAWAFAQVRELIFEEGFLKEQYDRSEAMQEFYEEWQQRSEEQKRLSETPLNLLEPWLPHPDLVGEWIQGRYTTCFRLPYKLVHHKMLRAQG